MCYYDVWAEKKNNDPLFKINYFIETVLKKTEEVYQPEKYLSIDESMIKYEGKNNMKVCMPNKPI